VGSIPMSTFALTPKRPWVANLGTSSGRYSSSGFEPTDEIYETLAISTDRVADRNRIVYRFRIPNPDGEYVCEQTLVLSFQPPRGTGAGPSRLAAVGWGGTLQSGWPAPGSA
jgi:hypothetical protein